MKTVQQRIWIHEKWTQLLWGNVKKKPRNGQDCWGQRLREEKRTCVFSFLSHALALLSFGYWRVWQGNGKDREYSNKLFSKLFDSLEWKSYSHLRFPANFLLSNMQRKNRLGNGAEKKIKGLCGWVEGGMKHREKEIKQWKKTTFCKRKYRDVSKGTTLILRMGCFANSRHQFIFSYKWNCFLFIFCK